MKSGWGRINIMKLEVKWQVFIIVSIGIFMSTLDGSILNIANPTIAKSFQISMQQVQWIVTAYMLIITASLIYLGRLGDQIGSDKIYAAGFIVFTLGSLLCSISPSLALLIVSRLVQGIGASMMMATGMGIISNTFPPQERGKALGLSGMIVGLGNMTGPSLGGILVAHFAWPVIFLINVPIGLLGFYLALRHLPQQARNQDLHGYDLPGTLLFALTIGFFIYALAGAANISITLLLFALMFILAFYYIEKKSRQPMLDLELFKIKNFVYGNIMGLGIYVTQTTVFFLLPFYMESILALSPTFTGLLMTITPVSLAITAPLAGNLSDKIGSRKILSVSLLTTTSAYVVFSTLNGHLSLFKLICGLALLGIGMGMFGSPNNSSIFASIPREKAGYGGGFIATVRNLSFAVGIAGSVSIFSIVLSISQKTMAYKNAYVHASNTVYLIAAGITLMGFIISLLTRLGGNKTVEHEGES
jgi:EmrB/QacA subfamily drug resistance transporter